LALKSRLAVVIRIAQIRAHVIGWAEYVSGQVGGYRIGVGFLERDISIFQ